jgi:GNAT superfamily N-acetyltransferase
MSEVLIREAVVEDVPGIVALLADDKLGSKREDLADMGPYLTAFEVLTADPNQHLIVMERAGRLVGTFQLTVIPGIAQQGLKRALIEAVRVGGSERGNGLGTVLMQWAVEESRRLGCGLVQLTSNSERPDAHRFYRRLGFQQSHYGFKMKLEPAAG